MTIAVVGRLALAGAFVLACYGAITSLASGRSLDARLVTSARMTAYSLLALVGIAVLAMLVAIIGNDVSLRYVAQNSSAETPVFFKVLSLWSADEGSLLLWSLVLVGYVVVFARTTARCSVPGLRAILGTLYGIAAFYLLLVLGPAQPFATLATPPTDGAGPAPLLQNHPLMAVHPPLVYLGFIGTAVPFALVIGALVTHPMDAGQLRTLRRWTLPPWIFLSAGLVFGALWSYGVLGWGGYWAWDPVENVALLPWLTLTALLHAIRANERRDGSGAWVSFLVVTAFALTTFGTFLTRGSILVSVHTFARSAVGPLYLVFLAVVMIGGFGALAIRARGSARRDGSNRGPTREGAIALGELLLMLLTLIVLVGTLYPLLVESLTDRVVSVGAPYFDRTTGPFFLAVILLMGVGPTLTWGRQDRSSTLEQVAVPALIAAAVAGAFVLRGPVSGGLVLAYAVIAFTASSASVQLIRLSRRRARAGTLASRSPGRARLVGALMAHLGIAVAAAGILTSSAFGSQHDVSLRAGRSVNIGDFSVRLTDVAWRDEPQRRVIVSTLVVERGGHTVTLDPSLNLYPGASQAIGSPSIRFGTVTDGFRDLYASLLAYRDGGRSVTVRIASIPGVTLLWIGGALVVLGGLVCAWAARRRRSEPGSGATVRAMPVRVEAPV